MKDFNISIPDISLPEVSIPKITWFRAVALVLIWQFTPESIKVPIWGFAGQFRVTPELIQTVQDTAGQYIAFPSVNTDISLANTPEPAKPVSTQTPSPTATRAPTEAPTKFRLGNCISNDRIFLDDVVGGFVKDNQELEPEIIEAGKSVINEYDGNVTRGIAWSLIWDTKSDTLEITPSCNVVIPVLE